jgi:hypothetical protein
MHLHSFWWETEGELILFRCSANLWDDYRVATATLRWFFLVRANEG